MDRDADLSCIEITVLDEVDHMADLGFLPAVSQILDTVPDGGQRLLFSATLDNAIDRLVRSAYLHEPVTHQVDTGKANAPDEPSPGQRRAAAQDGGDRRNRQSAGPNVDLVRTPARGRPRPSSCVAAGCWPALCTAALPRARAPIMSAFKHGSLPVLVATDVAARGIHVDEVGLVLHADPPPGRRSICTERAVPLGRAGRVPSSHSRRRISVELGRLTTQAGAGPAMLAAIPGIARSPQRPAPAG